MAAHVASHTISYMCMSAPFHSTRDLCAPSAVRSKMGLSPTSNDIIESPKYTATSNLQNDVIDSPKYTDTSL